MDTLPLISKKELEAVTDPGEYIDLFIAAYHRLLSSDTAGLLLHEFTAEQNVLMAYQIFHTQVSNGGFIQLIENGYGAYTFGSPLSEHLRDWGLLKTASVIDKVRPIYEAKKHTLEREKSLEEFTKLYAEHPEFEPFDNEYYTIMDTERALIKSYIQTHPDDFSRII